MVDSTGLVKENGAEAAGVGEVLASVAFAPNENDEGFGAAVAPLLDCPKLNDGAGVDAELPVSPLGTASETGATVGVPKLKVGREDVGVAVPELGADFLPKKSGTPLGLAGTGAAVGVEAGLPRPKENSFLAWPCVSVVEYAGGAKNEDAGGFDVGVVDTAGAKRFAADLAGIGVSVDLAFPEVCDGGDSGGATTEFEANGEEALGRVDTPADNRVPRPAAGLDPGTLRFELFAGDVADVAERELGVDSIGCAELDKGVPANPLNDIPDIGGSGILTCANSSIGGKSSSRAENRPLDGSVGEVARELP